ncbi:MAG: hypothetical protein AB1Z98_13755 [Nannocystaceae bacterium]
MSAFGDVTIDDNDALSSLAGAEFIGNCTTCAGVDAGAGELADEPDGSAAGGTAGAEPAGDGADEAFGGTYYGNIVISNNDELVQLSALGNLYYAWADVRFRNNAALAILDSLALMEVRGVLEISEHPLMSTVDAQALADGMSVLGEVLICGNLDGEACPQ